MSRGTITSTAPAAASTSAPTAAAAASPRGSRFSIAFSSGSAAAVSSPASAICHSRRLTGCQKINSAITPPISSARRHGRDTPWNAENSAMRDHSPYGEGMCRENHSLEAKEWFPRAPSKKADWIRAGIKKAARFSAGKAGRRKGKPSPQTGRMLLLSFFQESRLDKGRY